MTGFDTNTETTILGVVLWVLTLLVTLAIYRSSLTLIAGKQANDFSPTGLDLRPFGQRLTRAHANAYEFLPFALAIMILAVATDRSQITDDLAMVLLALRVGQSVVHLISTSPNAVIVRFVLLFIPQIAIVVWWSTQLFLVNG